MNIFKKQCIIVLCGLAFVAPIMTACSNQADLPARNPGIVIAGSSTVFLLTQRMAERFRKEGYVDDIAIYSIGTGAGFERFCKTGETDIVNASRPIQPVESDQCRAIGREPIEFQVGVDALAVVVNPKNTFAASLTKTQLAQVYAGQAKTWKDIDPSWPASVITPFSPGSDSGTFDFFVEVVMKPVFGDKGRELILNNPAVQFSENDGILVQGVEGDVNALGYFGYAYFAAEKDRLKLVRIEDVEPNQQTATSGEYPLVRPLFIYSDPRIIREKSQVAAFIDFYLTFVNEEILNVGYFPAPPPALDKSRDILHAITKP